MNIGLVGLGRMGNAIAWRLLQAKHKVFAFDADVQARKIAQDFGVDCVDTLGAVVHNASVFWLMVPAGKPVDDVLTVLLPLLKKGSIIIDGGNSHFSDSVRRYEMLKSHDIAFLDCGTSGGVHGKSLGFSLMIGGDKTAYEEVVPVFQALSAPNGFGYVGPSGSGHYVKMVHNGIEYALLQSYAEGFHLLKAGRYKHLNLEHICRIWNGGSIVRSWIVELSRQIFEEQQDLSHISGHIEENKTGQWTFQEAEEQHLAVPMIKKALDIRAWSRETGGNDATKIVALLRNKFGGHPLKKTSNEQ